MPLPAAAPREKLHTRNISAEGFRRSDGQWDIDAHIVDLKTYGFDNSWRGRVEPGMPVHEMWLRLTVNDGFEITAVIAATDASPYEICPAITDNFQRLVGLKVGPGWKRAIRERLGGREGCTHLVELLGPVATVAFQTIMPMRERLSAEGSKAPIDWTASTAGPRRPVMLDTCHALASDGPVVALQFPDFYTGPALSEAPSKGA